MRATFVFTRLLLRYLSANREPGNPALGGELRHFVIRQPSYSFLSLVLLAVPCLLLPAFLLCTTDACG